MKNDMNLYLITKGKRSPVRIIFLMQVRTCDSAVIRDVLIMRKEGRSMTPLQREH